MALPRSITNLIVLFLILASAVSIYFAVELIVAEPEYGSRLKPIDLVFRINVAILTIFFVVIILHHLTQFYERLTGIFQGFPASQEINLRQILKEAGTLLLIFTASLLLYYALVMIDSEFSFKTEFSLPFARS